MKNSIGIGKCVSIAVKDVKGNLLTPDQFGCLGSLEAGKYFLQVEVDKTQRVRGDFFGLERQGSIHATLKKDYRTEAAGRTYKRILEVYEGKDGKGNYVAYPANHFKLLELYKNGAFKVWEIGITMRNRKFYLVAQAVWNERAYRDGETVVLPAISDWVSLRKVMFMTKTERVELKRRRQESISEPGQGGRNKHKAVSERFVSIIPPDHENLLQLKDLEPVSKYTPCPETIADCLKENQGRIIWWNSCHGIGCLITPFGSARIHRDNLAPTEEFMMFEKGDLVEFDELIEPKDSLFTFKHEAIGVKPVLPTYEELVAEMLLDFIRPEAIADLNGSYERIEVLGLD